MLKSMLAPYKKLGLRFMPTGGITAANAVDYLALDGVAAVGGTWLAAAINILAERYRFIWHDVKWEPGTVRAVGYRKDTACTEEVLQTASAPAKLHGS